MKGIETHFNNPCSNSAQPSQHHGWRGRVCRVASHNSGDCFRHACSPEAARKGTELLGLEPSCACLPRALRTPRLPSCPPPFTPHPRADGDHIAAQKAEADLIVQNRGPIASVVFGLGGFLRSRYFANVRKSVGVFVGMWLWYVLNTKTYMPPEIEE